jgi:hypothetical protein
MSTPGTLGRPPDTRSDEALLAALADDDEQVRSAAAGELAARGHPQALAACLATLADAAEEAHAYSTPSGWHLVEIGTAALPALLDRLGADDPRIRLCAHHAVMQITKHRFGFDGQRWPDHAYDRWARWWSAAGYEYDAEPRSRTAAIHRLRAACAAFLSVQPDVGDTSCLGRGTQDDELP